MIESHLGPAKMKVCHRWTSRLFMVALLCVTLSADNKTSKCEMTIKVRRNTDYVASLGEELKIACPVTVCDNFPPTITWLKLETDNTKLNISGRIKTEWKRTNNSDGIYFLIFNNVLSSDSGEYQCHYGNDVSHQINVTVTDVAVSITGTPQDQTNNTSPTTPDNNKQLWLYVYTAAGIVGFVIVVIVISVLSMRGCNGESKKKTQSENQYMDIPMTERHVHHSSNQALPRASPCGTPSHRTSRKKKAPSAPTQEDNVYDQIEGQRNGPAEEGSSVVYAALNHQHLAGASPRVRNVVEETSEYSAIRVS